MALVTERPRSPLSKTKSDTDDSYSLRGVRVIDITPSGSDPRPMSYTQAVAALTDAGVDFDESYDSNFPDAVVKSIDVQQNRVADMWTFSATYGDGASGGFLQQPARVSVEPYFYTEIQDRDIGDDDYDYNQAPDSPANAGKTPSVPYTATNGTPFDPPLEVEKVGLLIKYRKPSAGYSATTMIAYGGATNSVPLIIPGVGTIPTGYAKFLPAAKEEGITTADNVYITLTFDVREGGWTKDVIDQAAQGWGITDANEYVPGLYTTEAGKSPAGSVLLDGEGVPIKPNVFSKVINEGEGTVDVAGPPDGLVVGSQDRLNTAKSNETFKVLSFIRNKKKNLNDLL